MVTIYDLFLNFQEVAYEFFEWKRQDSIEHIKKIPLVHVSTEELLDCLRFQIRVTPEFLEKIRYSTERYDFKRIEYACVISDGNVALAIEFCKDGLSIYKSRLLPEDEEEICQYAFHEDKSEFCYQKVDSIELFPFFTRKERKIKNFLEREILKSYEEKECSKLQYLYLEYYDSISDDLEFMKNQLIASMEDCLNQKHLNLYNLLLLLSKKKKV